MLRGFVIKAYNSYYYVQTDSKLTMCTLRGRFKKERYSLLVGDEVEYELSGQQKGVIEKILPRRSMLKRPMVANVDQVILTFAAVNPDLNPILIDRFLVLAELSNLDMTICINKIELANIDDLQPTIDLYRQIGYSVLPISAKTGLGIEEFRNLLYNKITVFAGPSGVGKSTILNALEPGLELVTGEVSDKIGRGKHTTRFAQLLPLSGGGFVVDTPGFSATDFSDMQEKQLMDCFPEISRLASDCKYNTCLHYKEPQCAVKQAVTDRAISGKRYNSYVEILEDIRQSKKGFNNG
ncbi:Small ribosomal subunit biogenesis GTPase RsgA [bioreactor metagenome]|uniref:Small ribosomal subunit biogenesis GTPase RsgA n=1 Tax=bioreactor metagenome TaxID=1076179 RepID=A0A645B5L0_9ZZZZ